MRYYAVLDAADESTARNVFIVDDTVDPIAMVVFNHGTHRWVQNTALIEFVVGPRAAECAEIDEAQAAALLAGWGAGLPDAGEVHAVARAAG